jgi:hypothetical protein
MRDTPGGRRPLGHSALTVPRVALGCGNFGGVGSACELFGQGLNQDQAFALMDAAWEPASAPGARNTWPPSPRRSSGRSQRRSGPKWER